jgi:hypothetical protein
MCEADSIVTIKRRAHPNDPLLAQQYAASMINATGAWQASAYGSHKVMVCMVDTGSDLYNKDLVPNLWKCAADSAGVCTTMCANAHLCWSMGPVISNALTTCTKGLG